MRIKALIVAVAAAAAVAVVAVVLANQGSGRGSSRSTTIVTSSAAVTIKNYAFSPQSLTVKAGTRVTWTNRDSTAHTATANQLALDTGTIDPGQSKSIEFTKPGTYAYHCAFHAFMTGTVTVVR
jgi:plastocyanin